MIIPCDGWSIEVPGKLCVQRNVKIHFCFASICNFLITFLGETLPAPAVKSWQFAVAMDNSLSETPEPFFYRKYFISGNTSTLFFLHEVNIYISGKNNKFSWIGSQIWSHFVFNVFQPRRI
jgi:hypothetical protein